MTVNQRFTIAAGTPINVATGGAASFPNTQPVWAKSVFIQMRTGGSGIGYVMSGIQPGRVPSAANASDLSSELYAASPTGPGGAYSYPEPGNTYRGDIDVNQIWIDGTHTGDTVTVTYDLVN